jgi:hypothetical protein
MAAASPICWIALRWVMGENSAKSMRGGAMDDVIFAGTNSRPSRNMAEVALIIDNASRSAPGAVQRHRGPRNHAAHRARDGFDLQDQRARRARARRADLLCGCVVRSALACPRAAGTDRPTYQREADRASCDPRGSGRHCRPACTSARSGTEAQCRAAEPVARRRHHPGDRTPARQPEAAGTPGRALSQPVRPHPARRCAGPSRALADGVSGRRCCRTGTGEGALSGRGN